MPLRQTVASIWRLIHLRNGISKPRNKHFCAILCSTVMYEIVETKKVSFPEQEMDGYTATNDHGT